MCGNPLYRREWTKRAKLLDTVGAVLYNDREQEVTAVFFDEERYDVEIFGVDHIKWGEEKSLVPARGYAALSFRVTGDGSLTSNGKAVRTGAGNLLFVPQDVDYSAVYTETEIYVIHFTCERGRYRDIENVVLENPESVLPLFRRALTSWQSKQIGYRTEILSLLLEILVIARRQRSALGGEHRAFERALSLMRAEYTDPTLSIADICTRAGLSDSYFRRQCRQQLSMSPVQYLTELRLTHAEHLLRFPSYSIESVALQSGFSDPKYFARVVRRVRGCVPSDLRFI